MPSLPYRMVISTDWYGKAATQLSALSVFSGEAGHRAIISHKLHTPSAGKAALCKRKEACRVCPCYDTHHPCPCQQTLLAEVSHTLKVSSDIAVSPPDCQLTCTRHNWGFVNITVVPGGMRLKTKQSPKTSHR